MDRIIKAIERSSCYMHVYSSGKILFIPPTQTRGYICDLEHLLNELKECRAQGGILFYSLAEEEQPEESLFNRILDQVFDLDLETQMVNPHPQVYYYYKSFVPYFNEALEAAAMDVNGLITEIQITEEKLNQLDISDNEFTSTIEAIEELKGRYFIAKNALDKLRSLHYTLCVKTEHNDL